MQYRAHPNGKAYPINSSGISKASFDAMLEQDKVRVQVMSQKNETLLDKLKPDTIEVSLEPKNMYLPALKAAWQLKQASGNQ